MKPKDISPELHAPVTCVLLSGEEQIDRVMQSTVGLYGDLQGMAGKSLQEIEGLELKALEAPRE